ncbi:hypothetical protein C8R43DRAFT_1243195 [Mycena crocata]|nr:hypothetical protein C8R43DRAFT_1243195 [Mycena crocata]
MSPSTEVLSLQRPSSQTGHYGPISKIADDHTDHSVTRDDARINPTYDGARSPFPDKILVSSLRPQDPAMYTKILFGPGPDASTNFELLFAPLLIGVVLNALLLGIFLIQVYSYIRLYPNDSPWIRYLIYYLIIMEIVNTICAVGLIYEPLITLHNSPLLATQAPTLLAADPIVTTLISTPTQLFMAWRIRLLTKSNILAGLVALFASISLVGGMVSTAIVVRDREFTDGLVVASIPVWLTSTAFADLLITALLVNFLWEKKTGFKTQTDSVTDRVILLTVQTGLLTSLAAIADVTLFLILPQTTFMFIWDFSLCKLYSISLVSTLTARHEWNNLLFDTPPPGEKRGKVDVHALIKVRCPSDIEGLQLYIPSNFESSIHSPRKRTPIEPPPIVERGPRPLPPAPTRSTSQSIRSQDSSRRTAAWTISTER